ncbi:TPA: SIMPL domain-containing protein [Candidatus Woesearchaeota archaeon]|nr:SIMPL domain-containing protein [Candidatus Woesearchaeota archaeon]
MKEENHKPMHGMLLFVLAAGFVLVALAIMFAPKPEVKVTTAGGSGPGAVQNTISVAGNAELTVSPDEAEIYIRITTDEPTAKRAQEENARLTNTVRDALKKAYDLDDEKIESNSYNLWPKQTWNPDTREYEDKGFTVQHLLKVTTDDLEEVGNMLDTAVQNGANGVDRISFTLSKDMEDDVRDQALGRAAGSAKDKAESLAMTLGVKLGGISSVSESNFYYDRYEYAVPAMDMAEAGGMAKSFSTDISPKDVTVRANVNVAYLIG